MAVVEDAVVVEEYGETPGWAVAAAADDDDAAAT